MGRSSRAYRTVCDLLSYVLIMCVYLRVSKYIYGHILYIYICIYIYVYIYVIDSDVQIYTYMYKHMNMHTCVQAYMHTNVHMHMHTDCIWTDCIWIHLECCTLSYASPSGTQYDSRHSDSSSGTGWEIRPCRLLEESLNRGFSQQTMERIPANQKGPTTGPPLCWFIMSTLD